MGENAICFIGLGGMNALVCFQSPPCNNNYIPGDLLIPGVLFWFLWSLILLERHMLIICISLLFQVFSSNWIFVWLSSEWSAYALALARLTLMKSGDRYSEWTVLWFSRVLSRSRQKRCRSLEPVTVIVCCDGLRNWSMFQEWWMIRMMEHSRNCFRRLHYFGRKTICEDSRQTQRKRAVGAFMITVFSLLWYIT